MILALSFVYLMLAYACGLKYSYVGFLLKSHNLFILSNFPFQSQVIYLNQHFLIKKHFECKSLFRTIELFFLKKSLSKKKKKVKQTNTKLVDTIKPNHFLEKKQQKKVSFNVVWSKQASSPKLF